MGMFTSINTAASGLTVQRLRQDVIAMWKADKANVAVIWPENSPLASEQAVGLSTGHPDEEVGNTLFHHSFYIVIQRDDVRLLAQFQRISHLLGRHRHHHTRSPARGTGRA